MEEPQLDYWRNPEEIFEEIGGGIAKGSPRTITKIFFGGASKDTSSEIFSANLE